MSLIRIGFEANGRPVGATFVDNMEVPETNWVGRSFITIEGDTLPDLSTLWVEEVNGEMVLVARTDQGLAEDLAKAQQTARRQLIEDINQLLATKPDGGARYDHAWQTGAIALKIDYLNALAKGGLSTEMETAIGDRLALIQSVQEWIYAVRAVLFVKRAEINAAADVAGVEAVTWDLSPFEIGAEGDGANPDPDVYMDQLVIM